MPAPHRLARLQAPGLRDPEEWRMAETAKTFFRSDAVGRAPGPAVVIGLGHSPAAAAVEDSSGGVSIMSWFFIALWAPFLVACANHNDKFLLSRDTSRRKYRIHCHSLFAVQQGGDPDRIVHSARRVRRRARSRICACRHRDVERPRLCLLSLRTRPRRGIFRHAVLSDGAHLRLLPRLFHPG